MILSQILIFTGHAALNTRFSVIGAVTLPLCFYGGTNWGVVGVAAAWVIAYPVIVLPLYVGSVLRLLGMPLRHYAMALWPATFGTLAMSAVVLTLRILLSPALSTVGVFVLCVGAGAITYLGLTTLTHGEKIRTVLALIRGEGHPTTRVPQ
jgi:hypothetical protein